MTDPSKTYANLPRQDMIDRPPSPWDLDRRLSIIERDVGRIEKEVQAINANISRLIWIIVIAFMSALIGAVIVSPKIPGVL